MIDNQMLTHSNPVTSDENPVTGDGKTITRDNTNRVTIASICIQNIFLDGAGHYANGDFVVAFCDALVAIAKCPDFHESTLRVLLFLMGRTSKQLCLGATFEDIMKELSMSEASTRRAIKTLTLSQIICKKTDGGANLYRLSDKLLNPRVAVHGNTKKLNKREMPPLLTPIGDYLLAPQNQIIPDYSRCFEEVIDRETGEIIDIL